MASFDYLSRKNRMALVHYVQSLGSFANRAGSPESLEALSKELAAPGEKTANKIPVSMAMAKLEEEFVALPPIVIPPDDRSSGADILRRVVTDPAKAARVLDQSKSWRAAPGELANSVLLNTPGNGFSVSLATLSISEWESLHTELLKRINLKTEGK